ncbi:MAG: hypothetical protein V4463_04855 [Pseudomonadota bacterium]
MHWGSPRAIDAYRRTGLPRVQAQVDNHANADKDETMNARTPENDDEIANLKAQVALLQATCATREDFAVLKATCATKDDLRMLEDKFNAKLDGMTARIDSMRNWMVGLVISMFVGFATQSAVMYNMLKPSVPPQKAALLYLRPAMDQEACNSNKLPRHCRIDNIVISISQNEAADTVSPVQET